MFSLKKKPASSNPFSEYDFNKILALYTDTSELAKVGGWEVDLSTNKINWTVVTKHIHEVADDYEPDLLTAIYFYKAGPDREKINLLLKRAIEENIPFDEELQIITAKGNERWVRAKGKAEFVKNKCTKVYGVFQDINEAKIKNIQLEYNQKLLNQTIEYSPVGIATVSIDGKILTLNKRICELFGYEENELRQMGFHYISFVEDMNKDGRLMEQLLNGEINNYEVEKRYVHKNEHIIWVMSSISVLRDQHNKPTQFIMHMMDITSRKKNERELEDKQVLLETLIDSLPLNVYVKDLKSRKILINKTEMNFLGAASKKEILGKDDYDLFPRESAEQSIKEDQEIFKTGKPMLDKETCNEKVDGTKTWFLSSKIPLFNAANKINGLLGISYNITDRKKYEEQIKYFKELQQHSN